MLEVKNLFLQRVFSPHLGIHINSLSDFNVSLFGKDDLEKQGKMITWLKEPGKKSQFMYISYCCFCILKLQPWFLSFLVK